MATARRQLLVRTAATEFAAAGYDSASLNRIIRKCGLSKSSFYHVIASKEELFSLVVADLSGSLVGEIEVPAPELFAGGNFWPAVDELFDRTMRALQSDDVYACLGRMYYLPGAPGTDGSQVGSALASVASWVRALLDVGRGSGAVRTDLPVELQSRLLLTVLRALDEWAVSQLEVIPPEQWAELMQAQKAAIRRLLATDAAQP